MGRFPRAILETLDNRLMHVGMCIAGIGRIIGTTVSIGLSRVSDIYEKIRNIVKIRHGKPSNFAQIQQLERLQPIECDKGATR